MDIKKLRKKWDNIDSSNLIKNKVENVRTAQQRVESEQIKKQVDNLYNKNEQTSTNTWQKVVNKANAIMNDTKQFSKNFALGAERGGISALGQTEFLSQQQFQGYRKQQSILTEARKNETVEGKLQEANRKYDEAKMINGVAISKQADINESGTMQFFNKKQEDIDKKMAENTEKTQTTLGRYYTGNVAPSLGQSTVGTVLDIVAPGMGSGYRMLSYGGNYTQDALATGKMNERQSAMYGMTMAGVETAMDTAMDIAKGKLIGETKKATGFKDWLKVSAKELGINSTFEGIGEALTEPLQEVVKEVYGGEADFENIWQRMGQSFVAGVASEALMEGASAGYGGAVNVMNKIQNGQQVSTTEIANALKEINQKEEIDIEKLLVKRFEMTAQELYKNTDVQKNTDTKLENMAEDISKSDYRKIKANQLIEESDLDDTQKEVAKEIANEYVFSEEETKKLIDYAKNNINAEKQQTTIENKPLLNKEQQTTSEQGKMAENTTSKQPLGNDKYSIKMPDSNFKYEKTGNVNEDLLDESMSKVFNNSEDTMKLNKTLKQIMKDKNVSIVFEENITDSQGNILDGKYENGKIIINPNSTRAFEHIATHELTHAIGTKEMLKLVEKYRSSDKVFEGKLKTLLKNYNKTELTEEALAEVSGQLFGTQEFINNVKNTNPNLFQKIYSEIKYLWHQLRGYKNESQFIDDLYYKWTQAYNSNAELNQTTKNMVGARETKYTKGTQEEAINRIKNGEKPADVYEDTGWYVGIEGDKVKTIISDSKSDLTMDLVNAKKYYNQDVKLSDILKHEDLYEVYPELKDVKVEVYRFDDEKTGKDIYDVGAKYVKGKSIDINLNYIDTLVKNGKTSELLGAVLHEVQHWVQNKEGFETGSSRQLFDELKNDITKVEKIVQNAEQEYKQYDKEYKTLKNKITEKLFREGKYSAKEVEKQLKEQFDMDKYEQLKDKATKYSNFLKQLNYYESKEMYNLSSGEKESEFTRKNMRLPQGVVTAEDVLNYFNSNDVLANTAKEIYNTIYGGGNNVIHYNQSSYRDRNNRYGGRQSDKIAKYDEANRENIGTQFGKDITRNKGNESDFRGTADKNNREIQGLEESSSFNLQKNKEKQLEIIQKNNPLDESLGNHTWITSVDDIKTYKEALEYDEYEGGNLTPDFKEEDLNKALETGEMTVYSSYPIEQGIFVTPSKMEAQNYAGSGKVYSKKIKLSDVAWIDSLQGQYAKVDDSKYAKQGNTEWEQYLEEKFGSEGTRTTKEQIRLPEANVLKENETKQEVEDTYTPSKKAQNFVQRQKNNFKRNMSDMLGISQYNRNNRSILDDSINELQKEYEETGKITEKTKTEVFEKMYQQLIKEDVEYYNENKELKNTLRTTPLYVSDKTKTDITDYGEFRKNAFGSVRITNDKNNMSVDTFYQELSSERPDLFPPTITTTSEQLERIIEISKSIRKSERNISAYNDTTMSEEYKKWAKNEFDNQVSILQKQLAYAEKYNDLKREEYIQKNQPYVKPEVEEIKFIYENRAKLRREVEKQERTLLLTDREKSIVDRLLNDEMDIEDISPSYNREAIIKSYYARQQMQYLDNAVKQYKQHKKQELIDFADSLTNGAKDWKDKKLGLQYSRETATRNMLDIMSKEEADRINAEIFNPILHNTSEQIRNINSYAEKIETLDLDKKEKYSWTDFDGNEIKIDEATLAQLLIEKKIDNEYLEKIEADVDRINKIADTFSEILEELVDRMDDVYIQFGYAPVERRKNYFPHFIENKPDTLMSKFANALGFKMDTDSLSTDIAGRTETFKPGRAFNKNILRRTTEKTDYNALKALDMYIQGATEIIYHTEDIQKLRAFNESIRNRYKDDSIKQKILEINENPELTEEERINKINEIKENIKTPLNGLVTWLDDYTNILANKKSSGDRQLEKDLNRQMYTTMQEIEGRIASNLIGGNLSVSLTNFAPLAQAMGTTNTGDILIGMIQTVENTIKETFNKGDNFVYESDFLTSRRGSEQTQKENLKQKTSNILSTPMELIDNFTSEAIVRAKYRENIKKGMEHAKALIKADSYARNLMGDRSKGALPTIFARKNPISKLMTSFQVEPNNIISNYFKDMPLDSESKSQLAWQVTKLSVASWAFNTILKSIRGGSDVIPNPIGIVSQLISLAYSNLNDDEEEDKDVEEVLKNVASDILGSIPFGTAVANFATSIGIEGFEDTGRFMVSNAIPDFSKLSKLTDSEVSPEYKKQVLISELQKPLIYLGLPTGGAQLAKTAKGLSAYAKGGSYTYDSKGNKKLQFPIEQNVGNLLKTGVFGKYSLPSAQQYVDSNFKSLNGEETIVYEQSNIDYNELKDYFDYSKKEKIKKTDKLNYIDNMNLSTGDKWNLYKHNIISDTERKDGTSQLSDAEYILKNKMATKSEYMKLYASAERNNVEFPETETLKELNDIGLDLKTYMDYKTKLTKGNRKKKEEAEKQEKSMLPISEKDKLSKSLNTAEKIELLSNYTDDEKKKIYKNYIGDSDEIYDNLETLTKGKISINDYLDYKTADIEGVDDPNSLIKRKTISGSKKKNLLNFLKNSDFSTIERIYIKGTNNTLDSNEKAMLESYVNGLGLTNAERKAIYKKIKNYQELEDGRYRLK